mmetsp:Transcript_53139/g.124391  ORF Transcript_53139/g.124391 Transcript_53139/m.124391 type:complete len:252 (+) Transcript_53139:4431-5186(+)
MGHLRRCKCSRPRLAEAQVKQRQQHQGQRRGGDEPADDDDGQRTLDLRAWPGREQQGDQAEGRDGRGHEHRSQSPSGPQRHAVEQRHAFGVQLVEVADQHDAVEHCDAQQCDEADRRRHGQVFAGHPQPDDAADQREWHVAEDQQRLAHGAKGGEQDHEDDAERQRHDESKTRRGSLLVLELAAPADAVARGELDRGADLLLGLLHESDQVATGHLGDDHAVAAAQLTIDLHGPGVTLQGGDGFQRDGAAV